jgi:hypothetical protein
MSSLLAHILFLAGLFLPPTESIPYGAGSVRTCPVMMRRATFASDSLAEIERSSTSAAGWITPAQVPGRR